MPYQHIVCQGESLSTIAPKYGLGWKKIYYAAANADFRELRPNPHVIYPGDRIVIPDVALREESRATDKRHSFVKPSPKLMLRLVMLDADGDPLAGCAYKLEVAGQKYQGTTGGDGLIEHPVPLQAQTATLVFWLDSQPQGASFQWSLKLAYLDPIEQLSGVQARLKNLAFSPGPVDGIAGPKSKAAVEAFQEKYKLKIDGIPGPHTQKKLKEVYGC